MYIMTQIISITDLRKNLFKIVDKVYESGQEIEITKDDRRIIKIVKIYEKKVNKR